MKIKKMNIRFSVLTAMILFAAFNRVIPHMQNFSPLGAMGLFGAAYFTKRWQAFLVPVMATWLSDLFINNVIYGQYYHGFVWFYEGFYWQYGSYLLITLVGLFIFKRISVQRVAAGAVCSTVLFFLISNIGCWVGNNSYPQTFNGLMACYAAGIPFIKGTILGDFFYCGVLFGVFDVAQTQFPVLQLKHVNK